MKTWSAPLTDRRRFLHASLGSLAGLAAVPLLGSVTGCQHVAPGVALPTQKLSERITLISGAPGNVLALAADDGVVLVDSGSSTMAKAVQASLGGAPVKTLFNTHYHADQTGGNALFGAAGATIHAHVITREWLAADYYVPAEDRWVKALPPKARPTVTFREASELKAGADTIECGYLIEAHTRGDIYVFFKEANVLGVGDVASPQRDPALDWVCRRLARRTGGCHERFAEARR